MRPDADLATAALLKRCLNREPKHRPSAGKAVATLRGDTEAGAGIEGPVDIHELIKRRVPQIVLVALGSGYALLTGISQFIGNDSMAFRLAWPFVGSAIVAATIIAWFHGERGKQQSNTLEWILLGLVAGIWLSISAWILIA
jgi:hypothetical protein